MYHINEVEKEYANCADAVVNNLLHDTWHSLEHEVCVGTYKTEKDALKAFRKLSPKIERIGNAYHRTDYELLLMKRSDCCRVLASTGNIEAYEDEE